MSDGGHSGAYSFKRHRDALYGTLEAAVREKTSHSTDEPDCPDNLGADRNDRAVDVGASSHVLYPSPLLWYEEMTCADFDAYHAHHNYRDCFTAGSTKFGEARGSCHCCHSGSTGSKLRKCGGSSPFSSYVGEEIPPHAGEGPTGRLSDTEACLLAIPPSLPAHMSCVEKETAAEQVQKPAASSTVVLPLGKSINTTIMSPVQKSFPAKRGAALQPLPQETASIDLDDEPGLATSRDEFTAQAPARVDSTDSRSEERNVQSIATRTTPPSLLGPPSSQPVATQTMFLPGLPSQAVLTQGQHGDEHDEEGFDFAMWDDEDGDENEDENEDEDLDEGARPSEAIPPPVPDTHKSVDNTSTAEGVIEPLEPGYSPSEPTDVEHHRDKHLSAEGDEGSGQGVGDVVQRAKGRDTRDREFRSFTRAVQETFLADNRGGDGVIAASAESDIAASSKVHDRGKQLRLLQQEFTLVPTEDILPGGFRGRGVLERSVVSVLEDYLSRVRHRSPEGYTARALELACHVLRQPTVCVRASVGRRRGVESSPAVAINDYPPEIVGVAGIVWEILRVESGGCAAILRRS